MINKYGTGYKIAETAVTAVADIGVAMVVSGVCVPAAVASYALLPAALRNFAATKYIVAAGAGITSGAISSSVATNIVEPKARLLVSETADSINRTTERISGKLTKINSEKGRLTKVESKKGKCVKTS